MDAVKRSDKELAMFDDPNARENLLGDAMKAKNQPVPAHAVSRAHFDTYLVRGMDVLYRVRLDLTWQITNGKADAAPQIVPHGEPMKGIRPAQLAKLKEQLSGKAELPDYLATADEKPAKAGTAKPATPKPATPGKPGAKRAVQRDGAFPAVRDIAPAGSLKASEWDPKTRSADTTVQQTDRRRRDARRRRPHQRRRGDDSGQDHLRAAQERPQARAQLPGRAQRGRRNRLHRLRRQVRRSEAPVRRRGHPGRRDQLRAVGLHARQGARARGHAPRDEARRAFPARGRRARELEGEETPTRCARGSRRASSASPTAR